MPYILSLLLLAGISLPALATPDCSTAPPEGSRCNADLAGLHPTQGGIGMLQVEDEAAALQTLSADQLARKIRKKVIPVVIGPAQQLYLVDRHHLVRALWQIGQRRAEVRIIGRLENAAGFWAQMAARHWAWLYDERGRALDPATLPSRVDQLPDYPYRSLAGMLQDRDYYAKKDAVYFVEFAWGRWLGQQMGWPAITRASLPQQLEHAARLACSPAAAGLPGYPGRACH